LREDDRDVLDFGCGIGRFSPGLAALVGGHVWAVDPIQTFLDMAPADPRVSYLHSEPPTIPLPAASIDVAWSFGVLTVISTQIQLHATLDELDRVLRPSGLLFLVEHASRAELYRELCSFADLAPLGSYIDLGQEFSIMGARKDHNLVSP
jgi:ubiquinone/menaquinone biosynthesis C-methylase UbiE